MKVVIETRDECFRVSNIKADKDVCKALTQSKGGSRELE